MSNLSPLERFKLIWKKAKTEYARGNYKKSYELFQKAEIYLDYLEDHGQIRGTQTIEEINDELNKYFEALEKKGVRLQTETGDEEPRRVSRGSASQAKAGEKGQQELPSACQEVVSFSRPDLTFENLAGMETVKSELRDAIELPLKAEKFLEELDVSPVKGILLYGPPGCGKTFVISCAAGEFNLPLFIGSPDSLLDKYVGNSEKKVAQMFECANNLTPSILFVDEIDTLLPHESQGTDVIKRIESVFLQQLSGVQGSFKGLFVAATNYPQNLSPRLIRPGRIDRIIYVPPPDEETRRALFRLYLGKLKPRDFTMEDLITLSDPENGWFYSSSGIKEACNAAKLELIKSLDPDEPTPKYIEWRIIENAFKKVPRSISPQMLQEYEQFAKTFKSMRGD